MNIPTELQHAKVCDLVNNLGDWGWQRLNLWLSDAIMKKIKLVPPPKYDCWCYQFMFTGAERNGFLVKNMYRSMVMMDVNIDCSWRKIWKIKV